MNATTDAERSLDEMLDSPLLDVPDDFTARVMAELPPRPARRATRPVLRAGRVFQTIVLAVCGALGALEVLLFVSGLWATVVAVG